MFQMNRPFHLIALVLLALGASCPTTTDAFSLEMMGRRGRKGGLKTNLESDGLSSKKGKARSPNSANQGRGQEITGVTLPAEG